MLPRDGSREQGLPFMCLCCSLGNEMKGLEGELNKPWAPTRSGLQGEFIVVHGNEVVYAQHRSQWKSD